MITELRTVPTFFIFLFYAASKYKNYEKPSDDMENPDVLKLLARENN